MINTNLLEEQEKNINIDTKPSGQLPDNIIRYKNNESSYYKPGKYTPVLTSLSDLKNLSPGSVYTYKQLCTILSQDEKAGNSKTHQLLEFSRFFDYEKIGSKYLIKEIYNTPMEYFPLDKTKNKKQTDKYMDDVIQVILSYLFATGSQIIYLNYFELSVICGLVNQLYPKYYSDRSHLSKETLVSLTDIDDFYQKSYSKIKQILNSALSSMQDRRILLFVPTYIIVFRTSAYTYEYKEATDEEKTLLLEIEYAALQEVGLTYKNELWYKPKAIQEQYYSYIQTAIHKHNPYWLKIYPTNKIITNYNIIRKEANTTALKQSLNIKLYNFLNDNIVKEAAKHLSPVSITTSDEWIEARKALLDKLIKMF